MLLRERTQSPFFSRCADGEAGEYGAMLAIAYNNVGVQHEFLGDLHAALENYEIAERTARTHLSHGGPRAAETCRHGVVESIPYIRGTLGSKSVASALPRATTCFRRVPRGASEVRGTS